MGNADFSWFALFLAGLSTVVAYTTPVGDPSGNAIIKPGLNSVVDAGKPFTVTWEPTTSKDGTVTILLERGPAENIKPLYAIAEGIKNTGTFLWTPKTDLEDDTTHYGLRLIVDATGQYQWSTQFGVSNPGHEAKPSGYGISSSTTGSVTSTRSVHLAHSSSSSAASHSAPSSYASSSSSSSAASSSHATLSSYKPSSHYVASTGYPLGNSTVIQPTGSVTVPHSLTTTHKPKTSSTTVVDTTKAPSYTSSTPSSTSSSSETPVASAAGAVLKAAGALAGVAAAAVLAI